MFERTKPIVSIVIPSWFTPTQHGKYGDHETFWFAARCMDKLIQTVDPATTELIVVDNGSTITHSDILSASEYAGGDEQRTHDNPDAYWLKADVLIRNTKNLGFAPACNQGFALARGEYVVCLNNDIIVWPGWLEQMVKDFQTINKKIEQKEIAGNFVGILMPALMKETNDAKQALAITKPDLSQNAGKFGLGAEFGSLWMTKRSFLSQLLLQDGYIFDENFQLGMGEDRDLWDRIRLLGYDTYRTHNTRVFHQGNMSMAKVPDRKQYTSKNREYLEQKRQLRKK